ncbi:ferredoxin III, nif-specific [Methylocella silvestris]|uniref:Ferredoxin III n=1 Tax=Methylocella silvestris TaxID=199596 RepID=A0A2J7TLN8_METSI|nr:ferredoxin III, nif-specific [Methylocella silvestris]PNG27679.1 ferredoxin III, nif-specific [Methylocella silvestris]
MGEHKTRGGATWTPQYLTEIDPVTCIGCGRCFKVCPQNVMTLYGVNDEGEILGAVTQDDDDDFDGDLNRKIMAVEHPDSCIGCNACSKVCPKNCQTHVSADTLSA